MNNLCNNTEKGDAIEELYSYRKATPKAGKSTDRYTTKTDEHL